MWQIKYSYKRTILFRSTFFFLQKKKDETEGMYNILKTAGSTLGRKHLEETKLKISQAMLELPNGDKHPMYGRILADEIRKKMSESKLGSKHFGYGKALSEEHRAKILASVVQGLNTPKVSVLDLETNTETIYPSMRAVARALNCLVGSISYYIKNKNKNKPLKVDI